jgi:hypothetical protein
MIDGARPIRDMKDAWATLAGGARLEAVVKAAPRLKAVIEDSGSPALVRTFDVSTFPYPAEYAFFGACSVPIPYVWMFNRAVLVEYVDFEGAKRRLLANPTYPAGSKRAPFFKSMLELPPAPLRPAFEKILSDQAAPVPEQLKDAGIDPDSIDYVTFDHLHVQDLTPMLGPSGFYPRAKLIATRTELEGLKSLHPLQRYWYVDDSLRGVEENRLVPFDGDLLLGRGLALISTPGHTEGNHTIAINLAGGLVTISENGVAAECYAPEKSHIPGLASWAKKTGYQVVLNANSREQSLNQYTSMMLEKVLAESANHEFPRHFCSSELTKNALAVGVKPTFTWSKIEQGSSPRDRA